jgi:hypothetical protein
MMMPQPPKRGGLGSILGGFFDFGYPGTPGINPNGGGQAPQQQQQPGQKLRRGLGDALMSLGAIGLGQDPFAVMQQQKQGRAEEEQRRLEQERTAKQDERQGRIDARDDEKWALEKDKLERDKVQRAQTLKLMAAFAGTPSMFGKEMGETMQNLQAMDMARGGMGAPGGAGPGLSGAMGGGQPQQGGLAELMQQYPNLDQTEAAGLTSLAQSGATPEAWDAEFQKAVMSGPDNQDPYSSLGKLQADLKAGLITPEQYQAAVRKETYIAPQQPQAPRAANVINFRYPDGKMRAIDAYNHAAINEALQAGALEIGLSAQGQTAEGLFPPATAGSMADTQERVSQSQGNLAELDNAMKVLERPEAEWGTGLKGYLSEKVGGVASQVLGTDRAGVVAGPKLEDVQEVRTTLQGMLGRMIPSITNDESNRYTEGDMQRVQAAVRATDPKATMGEIKSALKVLRDVEERAHIRERVRLNGLDPSSDEGLASYANELLKRNPGMDKATAMQRAIKESGAMN